MICIASSTGVTARANRSESPAHTPSGIPTRSERPTAASISARVCMLSTQRPLAAKATNAARAHSAARTPPKRSETRTPATETPTHVIQPRKLVSQVTRLSRKSAKPLNARITTLGLSALRWSTSQVWKSFRWVGSVFQVSAEGHGYCALRAK